MPQEALLPSQCLVAIFTYNNGDDLETTLSKIGPDFPFPVVVHVDGSTDGSDACLARFPFPVIRNQVNRGCGRSLKNAIAYARDHGFKAITPFAGNNKNDPNQAAKVFAPLLRDEADYVQGSRFLPGSRHDNTPLFRLVMVRAHAQFFSLLTHRRLSDALEGVRAYRIAMFEDPYFDIWQPWLDGYELETYIHYKVLMRHDLRYVEVPMAKLYPKNKMGILNPKGKKYSHIRPVVDWWNILKPVLYLRLGVKK